MKDYINERVIALAEYIIENKATVRCAAKEFGISKSTVHTDVINSKVFIWKWRNRALCGDLTNFKIFRACLYKNRKYKILKTA